MSPKTVVARLCWLYGRDELFICRHLGWSFFATAQALRPVKHLKGVALER